MRQTFNHTHAWVAFVSEYRTSSWVSRLSILLRKHRFDDLPVTSNFKRISDLGVKFLPGRQPNLPGMI